MRFLILSLLAISFSGKAQPPQGIPFSYFDGRINCGSTVGAANYSLLTFSANGVSSGFLEIGYSQDTVNWCYDLIQTGVALRDPRILKYLNNYYIAYTTGGITNFGIISSPDLYNWSAATTISVTGGGLSPSNTWAPSWFVDTDGSVHIIESIATTAQTNFQIYEQHPTTSSLTGAWSNPVLLTVTGQTTIIDPWITCKDDLNNNCTSLSTGKVYNLFYTICCGTQEFGQYASSTTLTGTYTNVKTGNWASWLTSGSDAIEGTQLFQLSDRWRIFFDYLSTNSFVLGQLYYSDSFDNWATWSSKLPIATAPYQAKHGQVITYP